jgi:Ca2+-binding RTX toxin-like protein
MDSTILDTVYASMGDNLVHDGDGDGDGDGNDDINGMSGADVLMGEAGNDRIYGDDRGPLITPNVVNGNDYLDGEDGGRRNSEGELSLGHRCHCAVRLRPCRCALEGTRAPPKDVFSGNRIRDAHAAGAHFRGLQHGEARLSTVCMN